MDGNVRRNRPIFIKQSTFLLNVTIRVCPCKVLCYSSMATYLQLQMKYIILCHDKILFCAFIDNLCLFNSIFCFWNAAVFIFLYTVTNNCDWQGRTIEQVKRLNFCSSLQNA